MHERSNELVNRCYLYSQYWTAVEANAVEYIKKYLHLIRFPCISLHCKLVPVQYRGYEYRLLSGMPTSSTSQKMDDCVTLYISVRMSFPHNISSKYYFARKFQLPTCSRLVFLRSMVILKA